jgi:hypothetical protein
VPLISELDRVAQQVDENLLETHGVADQGVGHLRRDVGDQLEAFAIGA